MASNRGVERLARFGYVVRGALYLVVGVLAVQLAAGQGGAATGTKGAIETIAGQPFGRLLLVAVVVGLAGYGLWGFLRAALDPFRRGHNFKGLALRAGYCVSGLAYWGLIPPAVQLLLGSGGGSGGESPAWAAHVLSMPGGPLLVGAAGVIWIAGGGLGQLALAVTASFRRDFESWQMGPDDLRWATWAGRIGLSARAVIFSLMGWFLIQAAVNADANRARGLDGALQALANQPYGALLLGLVALGLVCFGAFSLLCARWVRIEM